MLAIVLSSNMSIFHRDHVASPINGVFFINEIGASIHQFFLSLPLNNLMAFLISSVIQIDGKDPV